MDNKEDALSQSQMLKASGTNAFINLQVPENQGLEKMGVVGYHHISTLTPKAKLLSYIGATDVSGDLTVNL